MKPASPSPISSPSSPGFVRIIGGLWKRSKLPVPPKPGLRPTPDRVRETLFNWLGQDLTGWHCLDAFAGSGALGLEAASRGASRVGLCELDPGLVAALRGHVQRLQGAATVVSVQRGDALAFLRQATPAAWDVVFLDPPFAQGQNDALFVQALQATLPLLRPGACAYLEAPRAWGSAELAALGWACQRHAKAGMVHYHLLQPLRPDWADNGA